MGRRLLYKNRTKRLAVDVAVVGADVAVVVNAVAVAGYAAWVGVQAVEERSDEIVRSGAAAVAATLVRSCQKNLAEEPMVATVAQEHSRFFPDRQNSMVMPPQMEPRNSDR